MSSPSAAPSYLTQSEAKRRRLRKGTHSCWECKRRKMKCTFDPFTNANACNGCRQRGTHCVSQEFPEEVSLSTDKTHKMDDSNTNVEPLRAGGGSTTFDGRTSTMPSEDSRRVDNGIPTPLSMTSEPSRQLAFHKSPQHGTAGNNILQPGVFTQASHGKYEELSRFLHESLPSREDTETICNASRHPPVLAHEIMTMPYATLHQNGLKSPKSLLDVPEPTVHPVLISRHMLLLATFLQHLHPDLHKEIKNLSESPGAIMERLADLAISLVTTNDKLLGSIEGLECVMIESVYHANIGNLRRSWVAGRRAMSIAQLMGLDRSENKAQYKVLDPNTKYQPQLMWFRIIFLDRFLCLALGLPQGCLDRSMASDAMLGKDTPLGRLERIHCVLASQILERNEAHHNSHDLALTRNLDLELQRAARSLPSKWWLAPKLNIVSTDSQALFWHTRRLFAQVFHYNLLNQLHLPYMLHSSSAEPNYEYSRITCVNASREVLSRFITLRSFNGISYSCRTVDFLALMAAMTLLLAHLDSHLSESENLLAHQYHSDRAMIEQVQENMKEVNRLNSDSLSAHSTDLLRRLLTIEVETPDCHPRRARRVRVLEAGTETSLADQDADVVVSGHIPYFGTIKVAHESMSKEGAGPQASTATTTNCPAPSQVVDGSSTKSTKSDRAVPKMRQSGLARHNEIPTVDAVNQADTGYGHVETPPMMPGLYAKTQGPQGTLSTAASGTNDDAALFPPHPHDGLSDPLLPHTQYPELAAEGENWAFQGVDLAFFESLMSSAENEGKVGAEWTGVAEMNMNNVP